MIENFNSSILLTTNTKLLLKSLPEYFSPKASYEDIILNLFMTHPFVPDDLKRAPGKVFRTHYSITKSNKVIPSSESTPTPQILRTFNDQVPTIEVIPNEQNKPQPSSGSSCETPKQEV